MALGIEQVIAERARQDVWFAAARSGECPFIGESTQTLPRVI